MENIRKLHLHIAEQRGTDKTYCPSEVAKEYAPTNWRSKMDMVRLEADKLVASGELVLMQNGEIVNGKPSEIKGPIRLRKAKGT